MWILALGPAATQAADPTEWLGLLALTAWLVCAASSWVGAGLAGSEGSTRSLFAEESAEGEDSPARALRRRARALRNLSSLGLAVCVVGLLRASGRSELWVALCGVLIGWWLAGAADEFGRLLAVPRRSRALLVLLLPTFERLSLPLELALVPITNLLAPLSRRLAARGSPEQRRAVSAELREAIEEAGREGELHAHQREILAKVVELPDLDVAAVMTPRTEIVALDVTTDVESALRRVAQSGHSRVPVYSQQLDDIVGVLSARDLLAVASQDRARSAELRTLMRPAHFVPETKRLPELLAEMRAGRHKLAIVLDEYGGTAGLVTVGDVLGRIVGEIRDESDEEESTPIRALGKDVWEIEADVRLLELNERIGLALPLDQGFETLAGFVLSELGRIPRVGESVQRDGVEYSVLAATDRRVGRVRVRRLEAAAARLAS